MRRVVLFLAFIFCIISAVFPQNRRNIRYVSILNATVKESPGFFARELGNLSLGNEVALISESGKWSQVRAENLTGWVTSTSLSARRIVASGVIASATEISLAGKGFSPEMEAEYRKSDFDYPLDYSMVDFMETISIPTEELLSFISDGKLARGGN